MMNPFKAILSDRVVYAKRMVVAIDFEREVSLGAVPGAR